MLSELSYDRYLDCKNELNCHMFDVNSCVDMCVDMFLRLQENRQQPLDGLRSIKQVCIISEMFIIMLDHKRNIVLKLVRRQRYRQSPYLLPACRHKRVFPFKVIHCSQYKLSDMFILFTTSLYLRTMEAENIY